MQVGGSNYPLRGGKGSNWEGGIRTPAVVSGGLLPAARRGTTLTDGFVHIGDLYATFLSLAGLPADDPSPTAPVSVEAVDAWPWLSGANATPPRATLVLEHNAYTVNTTGRYGAMLAGDYKLLVGPKGGEAQADWYGWFSPNASAPQPSIAYYACGNDSPAGGCLFDLVRDPNETTDLSAAQPGLMASLLSQWHAYDDSYHPPVDNPPSDEAGLCATARANDWIVAPWRAAPLATAAA